MTICACLAWLLAAAQPTMRPISLGAVQVRTDCVEYVGAGAEGREWRMLDIGGEVFACARADQAEHLTFTNLPPGYWVPVSGSETGMPVTVVVDPATLQRDTETPFAVDSALSWVGSDEHYSVKLKDSYAHVIELMRLCGITETRERLSWAGVQPNPKNSPQWGRYLVNARKLKAAGIQISGMFHDAPKWTLGDSNVPTNLVAVYHFCQTAAREFGDCMREWEFWNEPDIHFAECPVWEFAAIHKAAALGFRSGNAGVTVANGATCQLIDNGYDRGLFANDIRKYIDVFNTHSYERLSQCDEFAERVRDFIGKVGAADLGTIISEYGMEQEGRVRGPISSEGCGAHSFEQELVQAEFVAKTQILRQFGGFLRNYFFVFGAYNERGGGKDWGALRRDATAKPSVAALSTLTAELTGCTLLGEVDVGVNARAFLYARPDGLKTLACWAKSDLDRGREFVRYPLMKEAVRLQVSCEGRVTLKNWCGTPQSVKQEDSSVSFVADRFVSYLSGNLSLRVKTPPQPRGAVRRYRQETDEDLTVIAQIRFSPLSFEITENKSCAELRTQETGNVQVIIWNLSEEEKFGRLSVSNGTLDGLPSSIRVPPFGCASFPAVLRPVTRGICSCTVTLGGIFNGKRISRFSARVADPISALRNCRRTSIMCNATSVWTRNDSAKDFSLMPENGGMRFDFSWANDGADRWFYPALAVPQGIGRGARYIEFEARSEQDKVENDFRTANVFFETRFGSSVRVRMKSRPHQHWEKHRVALPPDVDAADVRALKIGANPKGMKVSWWVRNVSALIPESQDSDETSRWQQAIDAVARKGGGRVTVPAGRHLVGQLDLRSNVELHLERGSVLEGLPGLEHYRVTELPYSEGTWSAVVSGIGVTNVAITGKGEIYGNGTAWPQPPATYPVGQEGLRARGIFFADSKDIRLEDFTLRDAACWGIVFKCCDGVTARHVTIDSHANVNNDGFDVEAKNVLIEDCDVDSGDDAFCVKSNNPDFIVENVTFRNCIGRSHCNVCKIGTATRGTVRNVRYENIRCEPPRRDFIDTRADSKRRGEMFFFRPGHPDLPNGVGLSMVAIENVDGGRVENIVVDGLTGFGYKVPLFVRGGNRPTLNRLPHGSQYVFRDIAIRNVKAEGLDPTANSITSVARMPIRNVRLEGVDIVCCGAGVERSSVAREMPIPDVSTRYPECEMFMPSLLPAYGLYVDQVEGLLTARVDFRLKEGTHDVRPKIRFGSSVREGCSRNDEGQ